jgi:hypothetical protein
VDLPGSYVLADAVVVLLVDDDGFAVAPETTVKATTAPLMKSSKLRGARSWTNVTRYGTPDPTWSALLLFDTVLPPRRPPRKC